MVHILVPVDSCAVHRICEGSFRRLGKRHVPHDLASSRLGRLGALSATEWLTVWLLMASCLIGDVPPSRYLSFTQEGRGGNQSGPWIHTPKISFHIMFFRARPGGLLNLFGDDSIAPAPRMANLEPGDSSSHPGTAGLG